MTVGAAAAAAPGSIVPSNETPTRDAPARLRRQEPADCPTHTHPFPRRAGVARRDARWTQARRARSGERKEAANADDADQRRIENMTTTTRPAHHKDSYLEVSKSSVHAERHANAARRRSACASMSSRPRSKTRDVETVTSGARNARALSPLCVDTRFDTPSLVGKRLNARATQSFRVQGSELASEAGFVRRLRGNVRAREGQSDREEERERLAHGRTSNVRPS